MSSPLHSIQRETPSDAAPSRVSLIGITGYGATHLNLLEPFRQNGSIRLEGAVVINEDEARDSVAKLRSEGCRIFPSAEAMFRELNPPPDLVSIPAPIPFHEELALQALQAGSNVLLEKPLAGDFASGTRIRDAARASGRLVAVGFQMVYQPEAHRIQQALRDGLIGPIREVRACAAWPRPLSYYQRAGWAGQKEFLGRPVWDSPVSNALAHVLHLCLFLLGDRCRVTQAEGYLYRCQPIETYDTAFLEMHVRDGTPIKFWCTHSCQRKDDPVIEFIGQEKSLRIHYNLQSELIEKSGQVSTFTTALQGERRLLMMQSILDALRRPAFTCTPDSALAHTEACSLVHQSLPIRDTTSFRAASSGPNGQPASYHLPNIEDFIRDCFQRGQIRPL